MYQLFSPLIRIINTNASNYPKSYSLIYTDDNKLRYRTLVNITAGLDSNTLFISDMSPNHVSEDLRNANKELIYEPCNLYRSEIVVSKVNFKHVFIVERESSFNDMIETIKAFIKITDVDTIVIDLSTSYDSNKIKQLRDIVKMNKTVIVAVNEHSNNCNAIFEPVDNIIVPNDYLHYDVVKSRRFGSYKFNLATYVNELVDGLSKLSKLDGETL